MTQARCTPSFYLFLIRHCQSKSSNVFLFLFFLCISLVLSVSYSPLPKQFFVCLSLCLSFYFFLIRHCQGRSLSLFSLFSSFCRFHIRRCQEKSFSVFVYVFICLFCCVSIQDAGAEDYKVPEERFMVFQMTGGWEGKS